MAQVLLIHPPVAKPGEPPAGIARLQGFLNQHSITCQLIDASLESLLDLLSQQTDVSDRWTKLAVKNKDENLQALRSGSAFKSIGHYNRIVGNLNRLISLQGTKWNTCLNLADCTHSRLSPVKSADLLQCAERPDHSPFYEYSLKKLIPEIEKQAPEWIGFSVNFLSQALPAFSMMGLIRARFPCAKMVLGGGLITSWMQNPSWKNPFRGLVDECVCGPGESFFIRFYQVNSPDSLPVAPCYNHLDRGEYLSPGFVLPYAASSGCYWKKCGFCPERTENNDYCPNPPSRVIDELNRLNSDTSPVLIHFLDNALSPGLLNRCPEFPGTSWYGYVRFTDHLLDLGFCMDLKKSGCVLLKLGLESGDQEVLDRMRKGIDLKNVTVILRNLKQAGIGTLIYLLFGTPYESETEALRTMDFVIRHQDEIGFINPAIFNMPVNNDEKAHHAMRPFSDADLSLYTDFEHPSGWNRPKVRRFLDRCFRRHPAVSEILTRTPKIFTSNHMPFIINGTRPI